LRTTAAARRHGSCAHGCARLLLLPLLSRGLVRRAGTAERGGRSNCQSGRSQAARQAGRKQRPAPRAGGPISTARRWRARYAAPVCLRPSGCRRSPGASRGLRDRVSRRAVAQLRLRLHLSHLVRAAARCARFRCGRAKGGCAVWVRTRALRWQACANAAQPGACQACLPRHALLGMLLAARSSAKRQHRRRGAPRRRLHLNTASSSKVCRLRRRTLRCCAALPELPELRCCCCRRVQPAGGAGGAGAGAPLPQPAGRPPPTPRRAPPAAGRPAAALRQPRPRPAGRPPPTLKPQQTQLQQAAHLTIWAV